MIAFFERALTLAKAAYAAQPSLAAADDVVPNPLRFPILWARGLPSAMLRMWSLASVRLGRAADDSRALFSPALGREDS